MRRVLRIAVVATGIVVRAAAAIAITAWLVGRVVSDRYVWSQWLLWIPTPAVLACAVVGTAAALLPGGGAIRRRGRRRRWTAVVVLLAAYFALVEHRMLSFPSRSPGGLRVAHWNLSDTAGAEADLTRAILALGGDLTILTNSSIAAWHPDLRDSLGGRSPLQRGPFTVLSRLPVRTLRWLVDEEDLRIVLLEVETGTDPTRSLVVYLVDLPSDPRLGRAEIARRVRAGLAAAGAPPPDLAVGDFNMTRGSAALAMALPGLRHAYALAGHGYGATFPREWPIYHIDHVLLGPNVTCRRYDVRLVPAGRHRAQVAWIESP